MKVSLPLNNSLMKKLLLDLRMYSYKIFCQHFFALLPEKIKYFLRESPQKNPLPAFGGALMCEKTFLLDSAGSILSKYFLWN